MIQLNLPLQMPTLPEGFCNTLGADWVQQILNEVAKGVAILQAPGNGYIIINQESAPDPTQRTGFLWRKPSLGSLLFQWSGGAWVCPHLYPPNGLAAMWVEASPAQIWAFDGGDGSDPAVTPPSGSVGAMWIIDPNYAGRSPMGVGAIPNSTDSLTLGQDYGEGQHKILVTELPALIPLTATLPGNRTNLEAGGPQWLAPLGSHGASLTSPATEDGSFAFVNTGGDQPHQTVHPVRGGYRIIRSNRLNYVAS